MKKIKECKRNCDACKEMKIKMCTGVTKSIWNFQLKKMPFGRYKGITIMSTDLSYLVWLKQQPEFKSLERGLRQSISMSINDRSGFSLINSEDLTDISYLRDITNDILHKASLININSVTLNNISWLGEITNDIYNVDADAVIDTKICYKRNSKAIWNLHSRKYVR